MLLLPFLYINCELHINMSCYGVQIKAMLLHYPLDVSEVKFLVTLTYIGLVVRMSVSGYRG